MRDICTTPKIAIIFFAFRILSTAGTVRPAEAQTISSKADPELSVVGSLPIQNTHVVDRSKQEGNTPDQQIPGHINGTIVDQTGAVSVGAHVRLTKEAESSTKDVFSGDNGQFSFDYVAAGPFQLTITYTGFSTQVVSGVLRPGQTYIVPAIALTVAAAVTDVRVGLASVEVAQVQVKEQEKQRVLGLIPNFLVSYVPDAAPLTPKLKFRLAWKSSVDPVTFLGVAALAGIEHGSGDFEGYGQGVQGYAKRFGASYANDFIGTFMGSAIFPSLLKQDPRYFYQGNGSFRSRLLHAISNSVVCIGDNGRTQPNYSSVLGGFAAGGIAYLYYPSSDRDGAGLFFENAVIKLGESSVAGVFQEFVIPKFTPHLRRRKQDQP
jgi:hypothetical protein